MTKKELSNEQLEELIELASVDASVATTWSDTTSAQVLSYMRKRGVMHKSNQWACITHINWPEALMQRFYLLAANAYIDRAVKEYRMSGQPDEECRIIEKFFREKLCFNADKHVTDSFDHDVEANVSIRKQVITDLGFAETNSLPAESAEALTKEQKSLLTAARDSIRSAKNVAVRVKGMTSDSSIRDVLQRRVVDLETSNARISNILGDESRAVLDALNVVPPVDNVHYFNRYCSDNYNALRKMTSLVYNVPDDMETTIWFHGASDTLSGAERFLEKIHKQCTYGANIIGNGAPTLIAPDLCTKETERKYGSNTDIMSSILDRAEQDQKVIQKITKKKQRDNRKKIILDDFKKNPQKKTQAMTARSQGKQVPSSLGEYSRLAGQFRPGNDNDIGSDDENEIIDEIIQSENKPIRILGMHGDGTFGSVEAVFDIPDEFALEGTASKELDAKMKAEK